MFRNYVVSVYKEDAIEETYHLSAPHLFNAML